MKTTWDRSEAKMAEIDWSIFEFRIYASFTLDEDAVQAAIGEGYAATAQDWRSDEIDISVQEHCEREEYERWYWKQKRVIGSDPARDDIIFSDGSRLSNERAQAIGFEVFSCKRQPWWDDYFDYFPDDDFDYRDRDCGDEYDIAYEDHRSEYEDDGPHADLLTELDYYEIETRMMAGYDEEPEFDEWEEWNNLPSKESMSRERIEDMRGRQDAMYRKRKFLKRLLMRATSGKGVKWNDLYSALVERCDWLELKEIKDLVANCHEVVSGRICDPIYRMKYVQDKGRYIRAGEHIRELWDPFYVDGDGFLRRTPEEAKKPAAPVDIKCYRISSTEHCQKFNGVWWQVFTAVSKDRRPMFYRKGGFGYYTQTEMRGEIDNRGVSAQDFKLAYYVSINNASAYNSNIDTYFVPKDHNVIKYRQMSRKEVKRMMSSKACREERSRREVPQRRRDERLRTKRKPKVVHQRLVYCGEQPRMRFGFSALYGMSNHY